MRPDAEPLFLQIATFIEDLIVDGALGSGDRAPSVNELAAFHEINPATARRGLGILVTGGILEVRRGVGTFVAAGAKESILDARRELFAERYVAPLVDEALRLGYDRAALGGLLNRVAESRGMYR